jgi:hypothetical protein
LAKSNRFDGAIYILLVLLGLISGLLISDIDLIGPKDFEDCELNAAKTALSEDALPILLKSCRSRFSGRRKLSGGYTYYDWRQLRGFDIAGPNPTAQEMTNIDAQYYQYVQIEKKRQAAEVVQINEVQDLQAKQAEVARQEAAARPVQIASANETLYHYVSGLDPNGFNSLALRPSPSFHSTLSSTKIPPRTLLTKLGEQGEWLRVGLPSGEAGWVSARYVACCRKADTAPGTDDDVRSWITLTGRDAYGGDYSALKDAAQTTCENTCRADTQCKAYSFDKWNRICHLKSSVGLLHLDPRVVTEVLASEQLTDVNSAPFMVQKRSKGFPDSGYAQSKVDSYDKCNTLCLQDQDCNGFNYGQTNHLCSLIQFPNEYQTVAGTDLGYKIQSP